jgi:hypothetical protein
MESEVGGVEENAVETVIYLECQAELVEAGIINEPAFDKLKLTAF